MNKKRRKKISNIINKLENSTKYNFEKIEYLKSEIEDVLWEEEDVYNNIPENLQYSIRGEESSEAIDSLQEAIDALEEAINALEEQNIIDTDIEDEFEECNMLFEVEEYVISAINSLGEII